MRDLTPAAAPEPWLTRLVAAYPPAWRDRYGAELHALICDLRDGGRKPAAMAFDLLRGAAVGWLTAARGSAMSERSRAVLYQVLWSWVAFAATAAWFGHDLSIYPTRSAARRIAAAHSGVPDAYHVLLAAGLVGLSATAVAAAVFAVGAARYARSSGRRNIFALMAVPPVAAAVWLGGLKVIPAGMSSLGHAGLAVLWLLLGAAGIAASTQAVITIARSCELSDLTWRIGGAMAAVVTSAMLVATGATITWGLLLRASQVHTAPQSGWLIATVIMAVATTRAALALIGARRAGRPLADRPAVA